MFKPLGQPCSIPGLATPESQEAENASHVAAPDACEWGCARGVLEALKLALSVTPQSQSYFCDCNDVGRGQPGSTQPQHPFPAASRAEEPDPHLLRQGSRQHRPVARSRQQHRLYSTNKRSSPLLWSRLGINKSVWALA